MTFPIYQFIFFVFAAIAVIASILVVSLKNPVHSVLCLVLTFFVSSILWMMMQAEFLSLVLIFVYVGAVMTLFLFVVMMLNIDLSTMREQFAKLLPVGVLFMACLIALLVMAFQVKNYAAGATSLTHYPANYSNVTAMGTLLYSTYLFPFEIAAVVLIVAIIAAIALAFHGRRPSTRFQNIAQQHAATKTERLRVVKGVK